jgi:1-acyl-sn-glycerol-3-phosphate acyltransferase
VSKTLRAAFFLMVVRPLLTLFLGAQVRHRARLPVHGPALIAANHNSHLDTLILLTLFPICQLRLVRPVAAADYFLKGRLRSWFALSIIGIIPVVRGGKNRANPLADCEEALDRGEILILFPEGSRGEPEVLSSFKRGIAHLARARPLVPVHPLFMHGLGKALPREAFLLVPFNCEIVIGEAIFWSGDLDTFMESFQSRIAALAGEIHMAPWL